MTRCRHCRIFFLTHPRNTRRRDLGCPFGCREAYRKQRSSERSIAYYTTEEGKAKKKIQNGKRMKPEAGADRNPAVTEARPDFARGVVGYIAMVTSLIERRHVSEDEIIQMLARAMRQHSIARRKRIDYVVAQLKKNGP
jgi:hypothetical protein